jgi:RNA:NAD 2'-phosphotransferase (TPT1/KptA family)
MQLRVVSISKHLARYLRHVSHELGFMLQPGHWMSVDNLLAATEKGIPITSDELVDCNDQLAVFRTESP